MGLGEAADVLTPYLKKIGDVMNVESKPDTGFIEGIGKGAGRAGLGIGTFAAQTVGAGAMPPETPEEIGVYTGAGGGAAGQSALFAYRSGKMLYEPQADQVRRASEEIDAGHRTEALGHLAAAAVPMYGPLAAGVGETAGSGDLGGAVGEAAVLFGPFVPKYAKEIRDSLRAPRPVGAPPPAEVQAPGTRPSQVREAPATPQSPSPAVRRAAAMPPEAAPAVPEALPALPEETPPAAPPATLPADFFEEKPVEPDTRAQVNLRAGDGQVGPMRTQDIAVDPERFQFKLDTGAEGVGNLLKEQKKFNPNLGGVISVWDDPADGRTYVINGHHRLELARRTGQPVMNVMKLEAPDAPTARAIGALQNIAEGRGTPIDAAKFFRDSGFTREELEAEGISLGEATANKGLALARLDAPLFDRVVARDIPLNRAVAIGDTTSDPAQQWSIVKLIEDAEEKGKKVSDDTVQELARFTKGAGEHTSTQSTLFGMEDQTRNLALEKAEISAYVKERLARERRLFGFVAKEGRAEELGRAGNVIATDKNAEISQSAAQAEELYNRLSAYEGPIGRALNAAAERLANGDNAKAVKQSAYDAIRDEVSKTLTQGQAPGGGAGEAVSGGEPAAEGAEGDVEKPWVDPGPSLFGDAARVRRSSPTPQASLFELLSQSQPEQLGLKIPGMEDAVRDAGRIVRETQSKLKLLEIAPDSLPADFFERGEAMRVKAGQVVYGMKDLPKFDKEWSGYVRDYPDGNYPPEIQRRVEQLEKIVDQVVKDYSRSEIDRKNQTERERTLNTIQGPPPAEAAPVRESLRLPGPAGDAMRAAAEHGEDAAAARVPKRVADQQQTLPGMDKQRIAAAIGDEMRRTFESVKAADVAKGTIRENAAEIARVKEQFLQAMDSEIRRMDQRGINANMDFIDRMEQGAQQLTEADQRLADVLRRELDRRRQAIQDLGTGKLERWIQNYFPHIWEKPSKAAEILKGLLGKAAPLEGSKAFLKERSIPTTREGIEAGLRPVSSNPIRLTAIKLFEMDKYLAAHRIMQELNDRHLARYVEIFKKGPQDWATVDDAITTVYGGSKVNVKEAFDERLMDQLNQFAKDLKIRHDRTSTIKGERGAWGLSKPGIVETRFGGPESVLTHEIGHEIGRRYRLHTELNKTPGVAQELRNLADQRFAGENVDQGFREYVQRRAEQEANLIHAYVHTPELLERVAPKAKAALEAVIDAHPELQPLRKIKPSLVIGTGSGTVDAGGLIIRGRYWMPKDVARVVNNYLSPGLGRNAVYQAWRTASNVLNQAQLGVSAFHAMFAALDATTSDLALAFQRVAGGEFGKAAAPAARAASLVGSPIVTYLKGNRLLKEYLSPGRYAEMTKLADAVVTGGGRVRMDEFFKGTAAQQFFEAWKNGEWGKAGLKAFPAALQKVAAPLMEHLIPRLKLGVFAKMAEMEVERLGPDAPRDVIRQRLGEAWDSVDNRMGQFVYDNLFWNKAVKDLGMASVRSLGWNLGSIREIGGGAMDMVKMSNDAVRHRPVRLGPRAAYVMALPIVAGWAGAVLNYVSTGEVPKDPRDYFFPRTGKVDEQGRPERVQLATYMKDVFAVKRDVIGTIGHKLHPLAAAVVAMLNNQDYYGTEIRHADDPVVKQVLQEMKYVGEQFLPFSIRNFQQRRRSGESIGKSAAGFFGITPAPGYMTRSPLENEMRSYIAKHIPGGGRTQAESEHRDVMSGLRREFAGGNKQAVVDALRGGQITPADKTRIERDSQVDPLVREFRRLPLDESLREWKYATSEEKRKLLAFLQAKGKTLPHYLPEEQVKLRGELDAAVRAMRGN